MNTEGVVVRPTRAWMACRKPSPKYPDGRTGTRAGYLAHYYNEESACDACLEGNRKQVQQDRLDDPRKILADNLMRRFHLSLDRYYEILADQDGVCAICRTDSPSDRRTTRFHVDHDHGCCPGRTSCGKCIRGLLCHACNTALGNFKDSPDLLMAAAAYILERTEVRHATDQ